MQIKNGSGQTICVGDTFDGPPKHKALVLKPGDALNIEDILPRVVLEFVTTPDGLRMKITETTMLYLPSGGIHLN